MSDKWVRIPDENVRTVWIKEDGSYVFMPPNDIPQTGVPIDEDTGDDLEYGWTEVKE